MARHARCGLLGVVSCAQQHSVAQLLAAAPARAGRAALTDNLDACRDLSGRRLRHVNADAKLAEWAAGARERELEKVGLKHIREAEKTAAREAAQQARAQAVLLPGPICTCTGCCIYQ